MKKIILLAACLFTLTTATKAQEVAKAKTETRAQHVKLTPEQRAQKNVDELDKVVTLTEDQKPKVKELALTRISKADAIRDKYKGQPDKKAAVKTEVDVVKKEYRQAVKAILTPEQLEKVKAKRNEMKADKATQRAAGQHAEDMINAD